MTHDRLVLVPAALALLTAASPAQLTWRQAGAAVPARSGHFAFFDDARGHTTVYAGQVTPTNYGRDCWQLEGGEWIQVPVPALLPRGHGACCEDPTGGVGLIFSGREDTGGLVAQTLRFDRERLRFEVLSPASSPPPRWITAMALDTNRRRAVLFGGGDQFGPLGDTWEWDGTNWQQRTPAQSPPARANHAMTYDPARGQIVLFGGHHGGGFDDTWVYDGTTWTNVSPAYRPDRLHNAMLAFDPNRNAVVLFGGKNDAGQVNDYLWEWNGSNWSGPVSPTVRPQAREAATFTYDKQRQRLTLIGGEGQGGTLLGDAWAWDGSAWTQLLPGGRGTLFEPGARSSPILAYSEPGNRVVLFGGMEYWQRRFMPRNDTWESAGRLWQQRAPATVPSAAFTSTGAVLRSTGDLFYLPGTDILGNPYNVVWRWSGAQWSMMPIRRSPLMSLRHQVVGSLRNSLYGWSLVHLVTTGNPPFLNSSLELINPTDGSTTTPVTGGGPGPRTGSVMVQSQSATIASNTVWLFGGRDGLGADNADLWELTDVGGGNLAWTQLVPATGSPVPPGRSAAAVAYHDFSNAIYVMGGEGAAGTLGDTWVFHLATRRWTQLLGTAPTARSGAAMIYDPSIGRIVLIGGFNGTSTLNDIWEHTSVSWSQRFTPSTPPPRADHVMAHDRANNRTIVLGGYGSPAEMNDTWAYDGSTWSPIVGLGTIPPGYRVNQAACFDESRGALVLCGRDTHVLGSDGTWTRGASGPPPRIQTAMVYVAAQRRSLVFGGVAIATGGALGDAWTYDATNDQWQMVAGGPPARWGHAMAYDRLRDRVVLFGGGTSAGPFNDTWEYQAATGWQLRTPAHRPSARWVPAMTYDEARGRTVLVGGQNAGGTTANDLWEWDGTDWVGRTPETLGSGPVHSAAMVYDPAVGQLRLLGGRDGQTWFGSTWELGARIDVAGRGNTVQPQGLRYYSQPVLGQTLRLGFTNPQGLGLIAIGVGPAQQPLLQMGAPFCEQSSLWTLSTFVTVGAVAEPNVLLPVPNNTAFRGTTLLFQGFPYQAAGCFRATDALHVRL